MKAKEIIRETREPGEYVYHAAYLPNLGQGLQSVAKKGLTPSKTGYSGPGVYFAYDPEGGFYHVSADEATMFRARWQDLVARYGKYPQPGGIERDDEEIIVRASVPADLLEVEYFPGEWWPVDVAALHEMRPDFENESVEESLRRGEYHIFQVTTNDGVTHQMPFRSDEGYQEHFENYWAKRGKKVVKITSDWAIHGSWD